MVRVTRAGEYAIRGMIRLAKANGEKRVLIANIAKEEGMSKAFLAKQFQRLARAKIVDSTRGAQGGIALARPAAEINLRDIVEAVEGPVELNRCLARKNRCKNAPSCPLADVWREAQEGMLAVLEKTTLAQVMGHKN